MCEDEMTEKEKSYEPIRIMEIDLESKKTRWLTQHGWSYDCSYVDSCWRWAKEIPSKTKLGSKMYMCTMREAIKIELNFLDN